MSALTFLSVLVFWQAHRRLDDHRKRQAKATYDDDPLRYTAVKTLFSVPGTVGILGIIARLLGKDKAIAAWWARLVAKHSPYWFYKQMYSICLAFYMAVGFSVLAIDLTKKPAFLYKYKIQKDAVVDYKVMLPKLFVTLFFNLCFPIVLANLPGTDGAKQKIAELLNKYLIVVSPKLPSTWEVLKHYWVFVATYDIMFFYTHWALHHKSIYAKIHKKHHEWKSPTALAAGYSHPIENVIANITPAVVSVLISKPDVVSFFITTLFSLALTLSEHCGYEFIDTNSFHNIHHRTFTTNYGVSGVFDHLHGTRSFNHEVENVDGDEILKQQELEEQHQQKAH